jgi:hypothetical protein
MRGIILIRANSSEEGGELGFAEEVLAPLVAVGSLRSGTFDIVPDGVRRSAAVSCAMAWWCAQ